jgi:hypothetical protein
VTKCPNKANKVVGEASAQLHGSEAKASSKRLTLRGRAHEFSLRQPGEMVQKGQQMHGPPLTKAHQPTSLACSPPEHGQPAPCPAGQRRHSAADTQTLETTQARKKNPHTHPGDYNWVSVAENFHLPPSLAQSRRGIVDEFYHHEGYDQLGRILSHCRPNPIIDR